MIFLFFRLLVIFYKITERFSGFWFLLSTFRLRFSLAVSACGGLKTIETIETIFLLVNSSTCQQSEDRSHGLLAALKLTVAHRLAVLGAALLYGLDKAEAAIA